MTLTPRTLRRASDMGEQAYLDNHTRNPFTTRRYTGTRLYTMDDLAAAFDEGYADAEREARVELRHVRSERASYFSSLV